MSIFTKFLLPGLLSGIASAGSFFLSEYIHMLVNFFAPGLIFGLFMASYFKKIHLPSKLLFILLSTLGYFTATLIANPELGISAEPSKLFLAGIVGSAAMVTGFSIFLSKLNPKQFTLIVLFGGILSLSYVGNAPAFFLIWQILMAAALGWVVEQNSTKKPVKKK